MMRQLAAKVPKGKHVLVSGTGHFVHVDNPELLISPLLELMETLAVKQN